MQNKRILNHLDSIYQNIEESLGQRQKNYRLSSSKKKTKNPQLLEPIVSDSDQLSEKTLLNYLNKHNKRLGDQLKE